MSRPATSRVKTNPPLGLRPSLENRRLTELGIDPSYQRSIETGPSQALIRKIAQFWDWGLFQPLVVARRDDGSFWVVDGQHRLAAAQLRGDMHDLPCVVTAYSAAGDEAAAFVALNVQRRALSRLDLFKAALAANDTASVEVMALIDGAGLTLAAHTNPTAWKPGQVANVGGILTAHARHGAEATGIALRALATAFKGQVLRYGGTLFGGIVGVVALELAADGAKFSRSLLNQVLASAGQDLWMKRIGEARVANPLLKWDAAARQVIAAAYESARGSKEAEPAAKPAPRAAATGRSPSFDEQLAKVRGGAPISTKPRFEKALPDRTLGGVGTGLL